MSTEFCPNLKLLWEVVDVTLWIQQIDWFESKLLGHGFGVFPMYFSCTQFCWVHVVLPGISHGIPWVSLFQGSREAPAWDVDLRGVAALRLGSDHFFATCWHATICYHLLPSATKLLSCLCFYIRHGADAMLPSLVLSGVNVFESRCQRNVQPLCLPDLSLIHCWILLGKRGDQGVRCPVPMEAWRPDGVELVFQALPSFIPVLDSIIVCISSIVF